jgi:site-specific recombinase XerD
VPATRPGPPLVATRPHLELYLRWLQEVRRFKPSTVSRRMSVVTGFYRTCVIDGVLEHSPAEYVRRPRVPAESPTLGLSHLQFEAMLSAAKQSTHECDFALVAMLGLLGLRIFEATGSNISDLGEEHGHRVLRVHGKGDKIVLVPLPPAVGRAIERATASRMVGRSCSPPEGPGWTGTAPSAGYGDSPSRPASPSPGCTPICSGTRL